MIATCCSALRMRISSRAMPWRRTPLPSSAIESSSSTEQLVARHLVDVVVELPVGRQHRGRAAGARDAVVEPPQRVDVAPRRVLRGQLGAAHLEHGAHLEHARDLAAAAGQREHQRAGERGRVEVGDVRARSLAGVQQAGRAEAADALAQRRARDAELHGEHALDRQAVARAEIAARDQLAQPVGRDLRGLAGRRPLVGCGHQAGARGSRKSVARRFCSDCGIASTSRRICTTSRSRVDASRRVQLDQVAARVAHVHLRAAVGQLGDLGERRHVHEDAELLRPHVELLEVRRRVNPTWWYCGAAVSRSNRCTSRSPTRSHSTRNPNWGPGMRSMPRNSV